VAIFDELRGAQGLQHQARSAAARGAILARDRQGVPLMRELVQSDDYAVFAAAVRAAQEMTGPGATRGLLAELNRLPTDRQIVVIQTLGLRRDTAALPELIRLARESEKPTRLAAVRVLPEFSDGSTVRVLAELAKDSDSEVAQAAQESLAALPGAEADAAVKSMLGSDDTATRLIGMELVSRRRMLSSVPQLLDGARDTNPNVRAAALRRVGELGGPDEVPALIELLLAARDGQDRDAAEQALSATCSRAEKPETYADRLIVPLANSQPAQKSSLIRLLSVVGGNDALMAVRVEVNDANPEVRGVAIRALSSWKSADAAPALIELAKTTTNPTERTLCLRGYLGFAGQADLPADGRLAMCREAAEIVQQDDEKRLLLGALGRIRTMESLGMIVPYLDDASTREEASAATVSVAEELLKGPNAASVAASLVEPLEKAAAATENPDLAKRARAQLQQARNR
jgi:hypothetical protein